MKNMQNFMGFHAKCFGCLDQRKLSFVYPFMHDEHAECSRFLYGRKLSFVYYCMHEKHDEFDGLSCMTNMQNFHGTDA